MRRILTLLGILSSSLLFSQNLMISGKPVPGNRIVYNGQYGCITAGTAMTPDARVIHAGETDASASYFLVHLNPEQPDLTLTEIAKYGEVIFEDKSIALLKTTPDLLVPPMEAVHGSLVRLDLKGKALAQEEQKLVIPVDTFALVYPMVASVDTVSINTTIAALSAITSRECFSSGCGTAQNQIFNAFQGMGLTPQLQNVMVGGTPAYANVICVQTGTVTPNEYVVVGAHYDSYAFSGNAPGADDDASGTAGVIELARIMKNYQFERTIIYCCFTAEEYGLYGSDTYAQQCAASSMDIQGYFNMDMIGYLELGSTPHTDMIYPLSAKPLADFFKAITAIFVPALPCYDTTLSGGDSDHTSFNNNGYMGIFPFEDVPDYSPYIHSDQDLIGLSVNNYRQVRYLVQANLASVATLARPVGPVSVNEKDDLTFSLYPNPATDHLTIVAPTQERLSCRIYDGMGRTVNFSEGNGKFEISLLPLPGGIYTVHLFNAGYSVTRQFILNK